MRLIACAVRSHDRPAPLDLDAELVDAHEERELLAAYRNLPRRSQYLVLELAQALQAGKRGGKSA